MLRAPKKRRSERKKQRISAFIHAFILYVPVHILSIIILERCPLSRSCPFALRIASSVPHRERLLAVRSSIVLDMRSRKTGTERARGRARQKSSGKKKRQRICFRNKKPKRFAGVSRRANAIARSRALSLRSLAKISFCLSFFVSRRGLFIRALNERQQIEGEHRRSRPSARAAKRNK